MKVLKNPENVTRLSVRIHRLGGATIVGLSGRLTWNEADRVHALTLGAIGKSRGLVIFDLSELAFMGAIGLGLLIDTHRRLAARGGRIALAGPGVEVRQLLRLTRVDAMLPVWDSVAEALDAEADAAATPRQTLAA